MTVVAITGGTGFLGAATVAKFQSTPGYRLRIMSRTPLTDQAAGEVIVGDITDRAACDRLVAGADAIVHAAGLVRSNDPAALNRINVEGTAQVMRAAQAAGVPRFVHVSSSGVYGRPGNRVQEGDPYLGRDAYERSKASSEQLVLAGWPGDGLVVVQPSNVIGVGHPLRPLRRFLAQIETGRPFVHGGGWANYVGVGDVARVLVAATTVDDAPRVIIVNVPLKLEEFVALAEDAVGRDVRTLEVPHLIGRLLGPALLAVSRRAPAVERVAALFAGTRFVSTYQAWFEKHELTPELGPVLRELAADYGIGPA